jgi:hypothetical protein
MHVLLSRGPPGGFPGLPVDVLLPHVGCPAVRGLPPLTPVASSSATSRAAVFAVYVLVEIALAGRGFSARMRLVFLARLSVRNSSRSL